MAVVEIIDFDKPINKKKNVCAYARVSSMKSTQETSLDIQVETYSKMIISNPKWNFMGVFADQGKSGTNTYYRDQFNLMLELAEIGNLDLIITKSISRFARNVVDCLSVIQDLKKHNTEVWFERENISSFDPKVEFVITVLAGMAEEESRNISENVKWNVKKRFESGQVHMATSQVLGYERDEDNNIVVNKQEAKIVRQIFRMYIEGYSQRKIANHLNEQGILTKFKKTKWRQNVIHGILINEKYTGNAILRKSYRPKIGEHNKVRGQDIVPKYYVENSHPKIISQTTYDKVQNILKEKRLKYNKTNDKKKLKQMSTPSQYIDFIKCGTCGKAYHFKVNNINTKYAKRILICSQNREKVVCSNDRIFADVFDEILIKHINIIIKDKTTFLNTLRKALLIHPAIINLNGELKQTQEKLKATTLKLDQFEDVEDEHGISIKRELKNNQYLYNLELARIQNLLLTTYNVDNILIHYKKLLKPYKKPINDIDAFPFKKLFNRAVIHSRDTISFDIIINPRIEDFIHSTEYETTKYLIRKTEHETNSQIRIY